MSRKMTVAEIEYHIRALHSVGYTILRPEARKWPIKVTVNEGRHQPEIGIVVETLDAKNERVAYSDVISPDLIERYVMKEEGPPIAKIMASSMARYIAERMAGDISEQLDTLLKPIRERIVEARERAEWSAAGIEYFIAAALAGDEPLEIIEENARALSRLGAASVLKEDRS